MDQTQGHPLVEFLVVEVLEHKTHKELQEEAAHQEDLEAAEMHPIHQTQLEMELQTREVAEEPKPGARGGREARKKFDLLPALQPSSKTKSRHSSRKARSTTKQRAEESSTHRSKGERKVRRKKSDKKPRRRSVLYMPITSGAAAAAVQG